MAAGGRLRGACSGGSACARSSLWVSPRLRWHTARGLHISVLRVQTRCLAWSAYDGRGLRLRYWDNVDTNGRILATLLARPAAAARSGDFETSLPIPGPARGCRGQGTLNRRSSRIFRRGRRRVREPNDHGRRTDAPTSNGSSATTRRHSHLVVSTQAVFRAIRAVDNLDDASGDIDGAAARKRDALTSA